MAECPFCLGALSTRDVLQGKLANCPHCGKRLTVGAPAVAPVAKAKPAQAAQPAAVTPATPTPAPPPSKFRGPVPEPPPPGEDDEDEHEEPEKPSLFKRLTQFDVPTVTTLFLGGLALMLGSVESLQLVGKLLAAAGLLVGIFGSVLGAWQRAASLLVPTLVTLFCLVDLFFIGSWGHWGTTYPTYAIAIPLYAFGNNPQVPVKDEDWVDASKYAIRDKELQIRVLGARLLPVENLGAARPPKLKGRVLLVQVAVGKQTLKMQTTSFESWTDTQAAPSKNPPTLTDSLGSRYTQLALDLDKLPPELLGRTPPPDPALAAPPPDDKKGAGGQGAPVPRRAAAPDTGPAAGPGRSRAEVLLYPAPPQEVDFFQLELPATAFGLEGGFRFKIPKSMITEG